MKHPHSYPAREGGSIVFRVLNGPSDHCQSTIRKYQGPGKKALQAVKKKYGTAKERDDRQRAADEQLRHQARANTKIRVAVDIANSLSVIADALTTCVNNRFDNPDPELKTYERECPDSMVDVLADERSFVDASKEAGKDT
ncbi:hypothetical protein PT974_10003 [Cladobotryum mycophilum]|uniref:Uncharacterized protein n=1 Tax=Cladobotryum mycophilum TaxID=491253 RepID=A0ABR0S9S0_9HYPO